MEFAIDSNTNRRLIMEKKYMEKNNIPELREKYMNEPFFANNQEMSDKYIDMPIFRHNNKIFNRDMSKLPEIYNRQKTHNKDMHRYYNVQKKYEHMNYDEDIYRQI